MPRAATVEPEVEVEVEDDVESEHRSSSRDAQDGVPVKLLTVIPVQVKRGLDVMQTMVFEHEVDILKLVHGAHNITLPKPPDGEEFEQTEIIDSAEQEFARLEGIYASPNTNFARGVYPRGASDLNAATGLSLDVSQTIPVAASGRRHGKKVKTGVATKKKAAFKK